jgi:hypothetical protein
MNTKLVAVVLVVALVAAGVGAGLASCSSGKRGI